MRGTERALGAREDRVGSCGGGQWLRLGRSRIAACAAGIGLALAALGGCRTDQDLHPPAVFVVEVAGLERFRFLVRTPEAIAAAEDLLKSGKPAGVSGELRAGDGLFNAPYAWHLDPHTVRFVTARHARCDALPSEVEEHLERWLSEVGEYCPWASRIVAREQ